MVTIHFKLSSVGRVEIHLAAQATWGEVLDKCALSHNVETAGIIAVSNGKVLAAHELVSDGDEIEVFPAISGG